MDFGWSIRGALIRLIQFTDANDPRKVIVKRLALCVPDREDMELDLTGDLTKLKKQVNYLLLLKFFIPHFWWFDLFAVWPTGIHD